MTVQRLIDEIGLRQVSIGGVEQVGIVDTIARLLLAVALGQRKGRRLAFTVLTP